MDRLLSYSPVLIDLAAGTFGIVVLGLALGDLEIGPWDDNIGCVCRAGPLLAIRTVAKSRRRRLACLVSLRPLFC